MVIKIKEIDDKIKKNLLDLAYNKYLVYQTTTIVIIFTYLVGLSLALISKQIDLQNTGQLLATIIVTLSLLSPATLYFSKTKSHLRQIQEQIKLLNI